MTIHPDTSARSEADLAAIFQAIQAATSPAPPAPPPEKRSAFWLPPEWKRRLNLSANGRAAKLDAITNAVGEMTGTPRWLARMAADAAVPLGRESELDDYANDASAIARAITIMGLDPTTPASPERSLH